MGIADNTLELLAPAGTMECLYAAVSAGANAVYLGLDEFNARRNAGNFTIDALREACEYAHLRGVLVYVTMNVEILPGELDRALSLARKAWEAGADALIVQDIGLASELHGTYPQIPWHASTQMNIHSAAGIGAAARLGASRITLARELSFTEIAALAEIARDFGIQIEAFGHGALCVCYSGQCLMSSMIGGRSANRGLCAQACRLPYELQRGADDESLPADGEHLLSPRDLCTIDVLPQMIGAGVASLKIEGRMKSADYVYSVVSVYREVIDNGFEVTPEQRQRLAEAFSRGFTTAYLQNERGNEIMSYNRPNNRGLFVGRIARVEADRAEIAPEIPLNPRDVVEIWTNRGRVIATVPDDATACEGAVRVSVEQRVGKGDRVFRVRNATMAFEGDGLSPRVPIRGRVVLAMGEPSRIQLEATDANGQVHVGEAYGSKVQAARTKPLSEQDVRQHVDRLGGTPFVIVDLDVAMDEGVGMGFSELHHLRADALEQLKASMLEPYAVRAIAPAKRPAKPAPLAHDRTCEIVAWATNPACARAAKRAGADAVYVPILNFRRGQAVAEAVRQDGPEQAGYPKQCVMALPTIDHDPVPGTREYDLPFDLWDYVREGKTVFADSLASCIRALEYGANVEAGPHVVATNEAALAELANMGVSRVWLSPELTLGQIDALASASPVKLGLVIAGSQELMITEHCLLMSQGACSQQCQSCPRRGVAHRLVDRKGFEFPVITDVLGRSHLYNGVPLDAVPNMVDFVDIGISAVMVDTTLMGKKAALDATSRAVRARDLALSERRSVGKKPGATTGHLFRGVS